LVDGGSSINVTFTRTL
jgi:hypothetical protein